MEIYPPSILRAGFNPIYLSQCRLNWLLGWRPRKQRYDPMKITDTRVKLMDAEEAGNRRCKAFCTITIENKFVVRDLRVIEGTEGHLFVAMPSRKIMDHCPECDTKNHLRAKFCNECGVRLEDDRAELDDDGRAKLHADIAHPINKTCREELEAHVLSAYHAEKRMSLNPGYQCTYHEIDRV